MSTNPASARPRPLGMFPRLYRRLVGPGHRSRLIVLVVLLALGVAVGGHLYAQRLAASDLAERDSTIQVLRSEGEKLESKNSDQSAQISALQAKLTNTQAELNAIMNEKTIDQFEEVLSQEVSDEALEAAGTRTEIAGAWTVVCTGIQCPG